MVHAAEPVAVMREIEIMRYAARMIFEYRVSSDVRKRSTCESRIVLIEAASPSHAVRKAKAEGRRGEFRFKNVDGQSVRFSFLGLADLISLDEVCEPHEVWYSIFTSAAPARHVREDGELSVFRPLPRRIGTAVRFAPASEQRRTRKKLTRKRRGA